MEAQNTQEKTDFSQMSNDEMVDFVAELIEIKDTVQLDKELIRQTDIFKFLQKKLSEQAAFNEKIETKLETLKLWLLRYYDGRLANKVYEEHPLKHSPATKSELEKMVCNDDRYLKLKEIARVSERNLQIIEEGIWQLRQRPKNIATMVDWRKYIETGM